MSPTLAAAGVTTLTHSHATGSTSGPILLAGTASLLICLFLSPKFGVSYVASDEPALRNVLPDLLTTLRLRASWGTTGRSPSSGALQTFSPQPYLISASSIGHSTSCVATT